MQDRAVAAGLHYAPSVHSDALHRLAHHPRLLGTREWVREQRARYVNVELGHVRRARRRLRRRDLDVLYFGDSTTSFVAPEDVDRRRLPMMLADELAPLRVETLFGGGYNQVLYREFVRLLDATPQRPQVIVMSLCIRATTTVHVNQHPLHGYRPSLELLQGLDGRRLPLAVRRNQRPTQADYTLFEALPVTTRWSGERRIGDFRRVLKDREGVDPATRERTLFDYFHGEVVDPLHPGLTSWRELGKQLTAYAVPVVAYRNPVPVREGQRILGADFGQHVEDNFRRIEQALLETAPAGTRVVDAGVFETAEFLDPADATEHLNERGRLRLARKVAAEVRAVLAATRSGA